MPELPEVEIARRNLVRWFEGRKVVRARAERSRVFRGASRPAFESIRGRLVEARRRGKYLLLEFDGERGLVSHLGMTGKWVRRPGEAEVRFSRAVLFLDDGQAIHYADPRMFGRMVPVEAGALYQVASVAALGPDPLVDGLTPVSLRRAVGSARVAVKVALMDQARLAGLGNIHAAEALFRAGIHPARPARSLRGAEWSKLCRAIHATIRFALMNEEADEIAYVEEPGTKNPFLVYGRAQEKCRRCQTRVRSMIQGGRTTHFCPGCQRRKVKA
jgi:formamidopyrimidine-DNA glycosylase